MSKERFFKGTFLLTSAGLISRIMGFFYRIFLSHTIGAEGIGLYQLVIPLQHLVLAMTTSGIQTALSRLISSHTALEEKREAQDCFRIGTFLALFLSGMTAWIFFTFSDFLLPCSKSINLHLFIIMVLNIITTRYMILKYNNVFSAEDDEKVNLKFVKSASNILATKTLIN